MHKLMKRKSVTTNYVKIIRAIPAYVNKNVFIKRLPKNVQPDECLLPPKDMVDDVYHRHYTNHADINEFPVERWM